MIKLAFNKSNNNLVFKIDSIERVGVGNAGIKLMYKGTLVDTSTAPDTETANYMVGVAGFESKWTFAPVNASGTSTVNNQNKTATPGVAEQVITPSTGYTGLNQVTVAGDADLVAENIKAGVVIFGVTGVYPRTGKDITAASVELQTAALTLNAGAHTIVGTVPFGTALTALAFTFTLSAGASAAIGATPLVSGADVDFTSAVTVVVTAENGTTQNWTVTITAEAE